MLKKTIKIRNGEHLEKYKIYECNICKSEIEESWPHYVEGENYHLCIDCSFRNGKITDKEWMHHTGFGLSGTHEAIVRADGVIAIKRRRNIK